MNTAANHWTGLGARAPRDEAAEHTAQVPPLAADATNAERMRHALAVRGPLRSAELKEVAELASSGLVAALLKHDRDTGRVTFCDDLWELDPDYDDSRAAELAQAATLLRRAGWQVKPPHP